MSNPETTPLKDAAAREALAHELKKFAWGMPLNKEGNFVSDNGFYFIPQHLPGTDFIREIVPPGMNQWFPEGAIGVRVDDDFWAVAALPYRFGQLAIQDIVQVLWPHLVAEAEYGEDTVQMLAHQ